MIRDPLFWYALANTLAYTLAFLLVQAPLALGLAVLLDQVRGWPRVALRFAFFSTYLVGQVFVAIIFARVLAPRSGPVHGVVSFLAGRSVDVPWLTDPVLSRVAVLLAMWWLATGLGVVYFLAALAAVDPHLYAAAAVDGAGPWRRFVHVTLPGVRHVLVFLAAVAAAGGLQLFELPYVLFQGPGPRYSGMTVVMYLFFSGFEAGNLGYASAIGWMTFLLAATVIGLPLLIVRLTARHEPET